jgi:hypothetical protein
MRTLGLMLLLGALLGALPGCSWLFVEAPPVGHERLRYFDCTESRLAPIVDTTGAVVYGIQGALFLATGLPGAHGETDGFGADNVALFAASAAVATAFGLSAGHGFGATSDCEAAKTAWLQRAVHEPAPPAAPRPCGSDRDCAGDRICEQGRCEFPLAPAAPAASPAPAAPAPVEGAPVEVAPADPPPAPPPTGAP